MGPRAQHQPLATHFGCIEGKAPLSQGTWQGLGRVSSVWSGQHAFDRQPCRKVRNRPALLLHPRLRVRRRRSTARHRARPRRESCERPAKLRKDDSGNACAKQCSRRSSGPVLARPSGHAIHFQPRHAGQLPGARHCLLYEASRHSRPARDPLSPRQAERDLRGSHQLGRLRKERWGAVHAHFIRVPASLLPRRSKLDLCEHGPQ
mmetsp:Transcript_13430/g.42821  ORF Transcript_13430/g.42821 Transcript_13430/m.42821 type:complete len:205 (-) Transcript_13430:392-1006(-)